MFVDPWYVLNARACTPRLSAPGEAELLKLLQRSALTRPPGTHGTPCSKGLLRRLDVASENSASLLDVAGEHSAALLNSEGHTVDHKALGVQPLLDALLGDARRRVSEEPAEGFGRNFIDLGISATLQDVSVCTYDAGPRAQ